MNFSVSAETLTCCDSNCGISFSVPAWWLKGKRETHAWFFCPNGHRQHFTAETDEEKMRRERDIARQQLARAEQEKAEAETNAEKASKRAFKAEQAKKKLERRTAAGTCPCCRRTFSNMSTHMRKQHPDFVAEAVQKLKLAVVK